MPSVRQRVGTAQAGTAKSMPELQTTAMGYSRVCRDRNSEARQGRKIMPLTDEDKEWITQQLERVETSLLTEFHKWASPSEMRARSHAAALRAIDAEMEFLADRVAKLEGGAGK